MRFCGGFAPRHGHHHIDASSLTTLTSGRGLLALPPGDRRAAVGPVVVGLEARRTPAVRLLGAARVLRAVLIERPIRPVALLGRWQPRPESRSVAPPIAQSRWS